MFTMISSVLFPWPTTLPFLELESGILKEIVTRSPIEKPVAPSSVPRDSVPASEGREAVLVEEEEPLDMDEFDDGLEYLGLDASEALDEDGVVERELAFDIISGKLLPLRPSKPRSIVRCCFKDEQEDELLLRDGSEPDLSSFN